MKLRPLLLLPLCLFFASCGLVSDRKVELPSTPILTGGSGWVIVKASYARLKEKPDTGSADLAALRDGSLAEVTGREFDRAGTAFWLRVKAADSSPQAAKDAFVEGWVPESELEFFQTKSQAERALRARAEASPPKAGN